MTSFRSFNRNLFYLFRFLTLPKSLNFSLKSFALSFARKNGFKIFFNFNFCKRKHAHEKKETDKKKETNKQRNKQTNELKESKIEGKKKEI